VYKGREFMFLLFIGRVLNTIKLYLAQLDCDSTSCNSKLMSIEKEMLLMRQLSSKHLTDKHSFLFSTIS
jgi:hypothetical protein